MRHLLNPLTFMEWHSLVMGTVGFWLGRHELPLVAFGLAVVAIVGMLPESKGSNAIVKEPWYFVAALLGSYLVGLLI